MMSGIQKWKKKQPAQLLREGFLSSEISKEGY